MSEIPSIPEKISKRKIIVYKSRVDPTIVKLTAEKMKSKLFAKVSFSKSKSEEIRVVSVDKYYEPYTLIDAQYNVQYFKKRAYILDVDSEIEQVKIFETLYKPEVVSDSSGESHKVIKLEAEMWASYQDKVHLAFDSLGNEIPANQVPAAQSEEHPEKILKEFNKDSHVVQISAETEIESVKARIIKRPFEAAKIEDELFQVFEHAVIYSPIYEITFRNVRTGEEKLVKIDGVTAKIIS